ncbi:hypothetical protein [Bifidobacterium biavatii]|uniref:Uncharacterized protein n=1 Tax=Bifidobacterium biavatii DSM 23969 TaxID=1437608 RepID=A0A087A0L2_9BIFI|nr:hypothetical protein [Bifidobacterium biavatii]KFI52312.1 hypothetical protein BBIA_0611 [Bifidobacterium biavatii DSM 23969]
MTSNNRTWQVSVDIRTPMPINEDFAFDLMDRLGRYGASAALDADERGLSVVLSMDAEDTASALEKTVAAIRDDGRLEGFDVVGVSIRSWDEAERETTSPTFPKVVGFAEIARIIGVTRQRAHAFPKIDSFPKPVIETAQGPLYSEAAVRTWAETRDARPGRPKINA